MSTNEVYRVGNKISLPVPSGKKAGDPVRVGQLNGVCATDRARRDGLTATNADGTLNTTYNNGGGNAEGHASVWLDGAHKFVVTFAIAAVGTAVYILADGTGLTDTATTTVGTTTTNNNLFGHALNTKGATSGDLIVRISN